MNKFLLFVGIVFLTVGGAWFVRTASQNDAAEKFRTAFLVTPEKQRREVFEEYMGKLGTARILDVLEGQYPLCHSQAHDLGKVLFRETGDINEAVAECRTRCTSGCFHGILMEAFQGSGDHVMLADVKKKIERICSDPEVTSIHREGNCSHGVGHALMYLAGYRIDEALSYCKLFPDRRLEYYCNGGAFMEYDITNGKTDFDTKPRWYPCDTFTEFPAACYGYKVQRLMSKGASADELREKCMELEGYERLGCFHGLGVAHLVGASVFPQRLAEACQYGTLDDKKACIGATVERLSSYDEELARKICPFLEDGLKEFCEEAASRKAYSLDKSFDLYFE